MPVLLDESERDLVRMLEDENLNIRKMPSEIVLPNLNEVKETIENSKP